jgi:hypothetical protein
MLIIFHVKATRTHELYLSLLLINSHQAWNFNPSNPPIPSDPDRTNHRHSAIAPLKLSADRWDPPRPIPRPCAHSPTHPSLYRSAVSASASAPPSRVVMDLYQKPKKVTEGTHEKVYKVRRRRHVGSRRGR